ncbi:MAG: hypothetical protein FWF46_09645 [Oscillospiraceae bacterium]|nr:hypothetical protein [Oscillospiraceae bacterium]
MNQLDKNDAMSDHSVEVLNGISNFYMLESRIQLMKELLPHSEKVNSEEAGNALYSIFIRLLDERNSVLDSKELNKAVECLNLIDSFEIDNEAKERLKSIKPKLIEMANISSIRAANFKRMNELMNNMSQPKKNSSGCVFIFLIAFIVISFGLFFSCK